MKAIRWSVFLLFLIPTSLVVAQQANLGGIVGTITDTNGSLVAGAQVVAVNQGTSARQEVTANESGGYEFALLPVGAYTVTVTKVGFKTQEQPGIQVISGQASTVNFQLTVGQVSQSVVVTGAAAVVDTTTVNMGTTRTVEELEALPVGIANSGSREAAGFLFSMAGVSQVGYGPDWMQVSRGAINGTPGVDFGYMIDGVDASAGESETGEDFIAPTPDEVSETRVTANTDTSVGFNGGVAYELTLKSGTNSPHGSFYYYGQNNYLNAHNWFGAGASASLQNENELGFTVGGPVIIPKVYNGKDKTFFFTSIDVYREDLKSTQVATIPTLAMRTGDFSQLLGSQASTDALGRPIYTNEIYNPTTSRTVTAGTVDPTTGLVANSSGPIRDPYNYGGQLNVMSPADFSTVSTYFQNEGYLAPTNSAIFNNFVGRAPGLTYKDQWLLKFDQNIKDKHRLSFSYEHVIPWFLGSAKNTTAGASGHSSSQSASAYVNTILSTYYVDDRDEYRLRLNYLYTINPRLLFTFEAGTTRNPHRKQDSLPLNSTLYTGATAAGLNGTLSTLTPVVGIASGYSGWGPGFGGGQFINSVRDVLRAGATWSLSRHLLKFGADFEFLPYIDINANGVQGNFSFSTLDTALPSFTAASTGWGYASYLIGAVNNATVVGSLESKFTTGGWGFYAQDTWRATQKLTLNYGVRWDLYIPGNVKHDEISTFDPTVPNPGAGNNLGALAFYGSGAGRNGLSKVSDYYFKAVAPRVGVAYAITPKTVVRANFSIGYYPMWTKYIGSAGTLIQQAGFNPTANANESASGGLLPAFYWDKGFPAVYPPLPDLNPALLNGQNPQYLDHSQNRPPMGENIGFEVERELPRQFTVRVGYIGTLAHRLPLVGPNLNVLPLADISYGSLLYENIDSPGAIAAGIPVPYPGFNGSVSQALTPYPQYSSINKLSDQWGSSVYNALQINVQRHFGSLTMLANYTISKWLSDGTFFGYQGQGSGNPYQHPAFRSTEAWQLASLDRPQVVNISWVYTLPVGKGKRFLSDSNRLVDSIAGGWRVSGIQQYQSGPPLEVNGNQSIPGVGGVWVNRVPGVNIKLTKFSSLNPHSSNNRYLNPAAFTEPAPFQFGNTYQLGNVRQDGYEDEDLTFDKAIPLYRESNFHIGILFLNSFNRHFWGSPDTGIANPGFGTVSSATNPRVLQYYARFQF